MIQRFLFTAAGRSNVFAYNLVCILKVLTAQCILLLVIAGWQNGLALLPAVPSSNGPVCAAAACAVLPNVAAPMLWLNNTLNQSQQCMPACIWTHGHKQSY